MSRDPGRLWLGLLTGIALTFVVSCSATNESTSVNGGGVCGLGARLDGRWYVANGGIRVIPELGEPLGVATVPDCEGDDGYSFQAMSIVGVRAEVAFADPTREDVIFVQEDIQSLPPELMRLRREPTCDDKDAPIRLHGPWLGIIGPHEETEVDLVPPYKLEMLVDDASTSRYERTFLTVRVAAGSGRLLTRKDVRMSLWEGGTLSVTATCAKGRFWATDATAQPPA